MDDDLPYYLKRHPGLTRWEKTIFIALVVLMVPLATLGMPLLGLGACGLCLFWLLRMIWHTWRGPQISANDLAPRRINLARFVSKPAKMLAPRSNVVISEDRPPGARDETSPLHLDK